VFVPFIIGLLVGATIRRVVKVVFSVIALIIVLSATGYITVTFQGIYDSAILVLPAILGVQSVLPYFSMTFLFGLALGLWQG
jgi:ABC-type enterochelin transport system permease subunit